MRFDVGQEKGRQQHMNMITTGREVDLVAIASSYTAADTTTTTTTTAATTTTTTPATTTATTTTTTTTTAATTTYYYYYYHSQKDRSPSATAEVEYCLQAAKRNTN